ncbi:MAG: hypothetical protein QOJ19_3452 [Acidimicrobiia bacterium]|nr:hypothetical protein [Acidimicrobiia bacterium]
MANTKTIRSRSLALDPGAERKAVRGHRPQEWPFTALAAARPVSGKVKRSAWLGLRPEADAPAPQRGLQAAARCPVWSPYTVWRRQRALTLRYCLCFVIVSAGSTPAWSLPLARLRRTNASMASAGTPHQPVKRRRGAQRRDLQHQPRLRPRRHRPAPAPSHTAVVMHQRRALRSEPLYVRRLGAEGGRKRGQQHDPSGPLASRRPFKAAVAARLMSHNPLVGIRRPTAGRSPPGTGSRRRLGSSCGSSKATDVAAVGVPAQVRAAHRRAGLTAVAQHRSPDAGRPDRRVRLDTGLRGHGFRGQEPRRRPDDRGRRRPHRGAVPPTQTAGGRTPRHRSLRGEPRGVHPSRLRTSMSGVAAAVPEHLARNHRTVPSSSTPRRPPTSSACDKRSSLAYRVQHHPRQRRADC